MRTGMNRARVELARACAGGSVSLLEGEQAGGRVPRSDVGVQQPSFYGVASASFWASPCSVAQVPAASTATGEAVGSTTR